MTIPAMLGPGVRRWQHLAPLLFFSFVDKNQKLNPGFELRFGSPHRSLLLGKVG